MDLQTQRLMMAAAGAGETKPYIDDVFSTYVYAGTSANRSINNGMDMSSSGGGLTWIKKRTGSESNYLFDTDRGAGKYLQSNGNNAEGTNNDYLSAFNNNGFSLGDYNDVNGSGQDYVSWTFRKVPGFFDVVTYTGNGSNQTISHSLGCTPGMMLVKSTSTVEAWNVYHVGTDSSAPQNYKLTLNTTAARASESSRWNNTAPTATQFTVGSSNEVNQNGTTYVAYLFAGGESTAATARSVDFDGTGDSLSFAASNDFHLSGDFTIECWVKPEANSNEHIFALGTYGTDEGVLCYIYNDKLYVKTTGTNDLIVADPGPPIGQWTHVAVVRSGSTVNVYLNGTLTKSYTYNTGWGSNSNKTFWIGGSHPGSQFFEGKISNFRVVKGTAVYTSSFRPPTEPLTNITNTKLLCCNNSSTTGSTVTPGTITANGDPTASTDSPFADSAGLVFGKNEDQEVIKCGSYVGNNSSDGPEINLGWEPQFIILKESSDSGNNWRMYDSMRGIITGGDDAELYPSSSDEEDPNNEFLELTPTGFKLKTSDSAVNDNQTYVFMAIRRPDPYVGKPIKAGTEVFNIGAGQNSEPGFVAGFPVDWAMDRDPSSGGAMYTGARLQGQFALGTHDNSPEFATTSRVFDYSNGWNVSRGANSPQLSWMWRRYAGYDVVAYKGNGVAGRRLSHNLSVSPEMIWTKKRSSGNANWMVWHKGLNGGGANAATWYIVLNNTSGQTANSDIYGSTSAILPTSTDWTVGSNAGVNESGSNFLAMLFASVSGISKVGYYTGNGSTQTITTGFAPRFAIIRRVDGSEDHWVVLDTTRGWASGDDKVLKLNSTDAQGTSEDMGVPTSTGFSLTSNGWVNYNTGKFIYYVHA